MNKIMSMMSENLERQGFKLLDPKSYDQFKVKETADRKGMKVYHKEDGPDAYKLVFVLPPMTQEELDEYGLHKEYMLGLDEKDRVELREEDGLGLTIMVTWKDESGAKDTSSGKYDSHFHPLDGTGKTQIRKHPYLLITPDCVGTIGEYLGNDFGNGVGAAKVWHEENKGTPGMHKNEDFERLKINLLTSFEKERDLYKARHNNIGDDNLEDATELVEGTDFTNAEELKKLSKGFDELRNKPYYPY